MHNDTANKVLYMCLVGLFNKRLIHRNYGVYKTSFTSPREGIFFDYRKMY